MKTTLPPIFFSALLSILVTFSTLAQPTAGLQLWLKADAITGLNDGDPVALWPDSSGAGNHASNASVPNQPTFRASALHGLPAVQFRDGGNVANAGQFLDSLLTLTANGTSFSVFVVVRSEISAKGRDTILQPLNEPAAVNNGRTVLYLENNVSGLYKFKSFASETSFEAPTAYTPGAWAVATLVQDATASRLSFWQNGLANGSLPMGPFTSAHGAWRIGDNKPRSAGLEGQIAEILVYSSALSETARIEVEDYLYAKYALSPGAGTEALFRDNFNVSTNSLDVNFETAWNFGRQSGRAGTMNYLEDTSAATDPLSQINTADAPGALRLEANAARNFVSVSPNHNFTEGGNFAIQFDLDAGINDPDHASSDWACIVFGATSPNVFVNASDGFGILFRNNGDIQVFDKTTSIYGGPGDFPGGLPRGRFTARVEVEMAGFQGSSPATIRMFVDDTPVRLSSGSVEYVKASGFTANFLTLGASAFGGSNWVHVFDNLLVTAVPCISPSTYLVKSQPGQTNQSVAITIPTALNLNSSVEVTVTSADPSIARPLGAAADSLTLTFPAGGASSMSFSVQALAKGTVEFTLTGPEGACIGGSIQVQVGASLLSNPSFENNFNPAVPHYSQVDQWTQIPGGGPGVNEADGPFHDNGVIPDRTRVAFHQGNGGLSQFVSGLVPGEPHWLQFYYNVRNCCGGTMSLAVRVGGVTLTNLSDIKPVGAGNPYHFRSVPFTPTSDTALLQFATIAVNDASFLLDAVTIVRRDTNQVVVRNPSFEASGLPPEAGYVSPAPIAGWTGTGNYGVNQSGPGPFADNGRNADQDLVAFIQQVGSLSQVVSNLVVGQEYQILYSYNARNGNTPTLRVSMGGAVLHEEQVMPVGGSEPYHRRVNRWIADAAFATLRFEQLDDFGDNTILIDDVQVIGLAMPPCETTLSVEQVNFFNNQPLASDEVLVTLPRYVVATSSVPVTIISLTPSVAIPAGAAGDRLTLTFQAGGTNTLSFRVTPVGSGTALFLVTNQLDCASALLTVLNRRSFVLNPSFEDNAQGGVGYGPIASWAGPSGVNRVGQPFADNGIMPDRGQIAFVQGIGTLRQMLYGLDPSKQYWVQLYANARNCCGDFPVASVSFNGVALIPPTPVPAVGAGNPYYFVNLPFQPDAATGELAIISGPTLTGGDRTLLVDAVSVIARDASQVVMQNPSFEASGNPPWPGYIQPASLAGWIGTGNYGVNISGQGPFADNGVAPDQDNAAFLQDQGASLSQTVTGLVAGATYALSYAYNARGGNTPQLQVTLGETLVHDQVVAPVGASNPYRTTNILFTAASDSVTVTFTQAAAGDHTVLLDNVQLAAPPVRLTITRFSPTSVRLAWPTWAGATWTLQSAPALAGPWTDVNQPVNTEGADYAVYDGIAPAARFYRIQRGQ